MSIRVYWLDSRRVDPARVMQWMSPARREKLGIIASPEGRRQSAAAEMALALAMAQERNVPLQPVHWHVRPGGKPALASGPCFSLSHAGDAVVCAICGHEVGVDIERPRVVPAAMRRKILSEAESGRADSALLHTWVAKESFLKMTGEGLKRPMTSFAVMGSQIDADGAVLAHVRTLEFPWEGYVLCACTAHAEDAQLIELKW